MSVYIAKEELLKLKIHFMQSVQEKVSKIELLVMKPETQKSQETHKSALKNILSITHPLTGTARVFKFDGIALICNKLEDYIAGILSNNKIISSEELSKILNHSGLLASYAEEFLTQKEMDDSAFQEKYHKQLETNKKNILPPSKIQILVVGITEVITKKVLAGLVDMNYQLSYALNTMEAFNRLSQEKFDLIIAPHCMSPINGVTFCLAIKNQWPEKQSRVILLSEDSVQIKDYKTSLPDKTIIKSSSLDQQLMEYLHQEYSTFRKDKTRVVNQVKRVIKNIFFVEDDGNILDLFSDVFEERKDLVLFNEVTKKDPFERIVQLRPDLIIADIQVPNVDTLELVRKISAHKDLCNIPVVFFSGDPEQPLAQDLTKNGALAVLDKTIILTSMFEELEKLGLELQTIS